MDWEEVESQIEDCEKRSEKLSEWELSFIDSISRQFAKTGALSERQIETLDRIWERIT